MPSAAATSWVRRRTEPTAARGWWVSRRRRRRWWWAKATSARWSSRWACCSACCSCRDRPCPWTWRTTRPTTAMARRRRMSWTTLPATRRTGGVERPRRMAVGPGATATATAAGDKTQATTRTKVDGDGTGSTTTTSDCEFLAAATYHCDDASYRSRRHYCWYRRRHRRRLRGLDGGGLPVDAIAIVDRDHRLSPQHGEGRMASSSYAPLWSSSSLQW